jgi:hypothetical protein
LSPPDRRAYLQSRQCDPLLWPLLHDPSTHWSTFQTVPARYLSYVWEDSQPPKRKRPPPTTYGVGRMAPNVHPPVRRDRQLVDLDREASEGPEVLPLTDYDVS